MIFVTFITCPTNGTTLRAGIRPHFAQLQQGASQLLCCLLLKLDILGQLGRTVENANLWVSKINAHLKYNSLPYEVFEETKNKEGKENLKGEGKQLGVES